MATPSPRSLPTVRAGIYTRISYDPAGGTSRRRTHTVAVIPYRSAQSVVPWHLPPV